MLMSRVDPWFARIAVAAVFLAAMGHVAVRSQQLSARLSGTVTDAMRGAVSGAAVEVRDVATGVSRLTTTDEYGKFTFLVPPGTYALRVSAPGFSPTEQRLTVRTNEAPNVSVVIRVAGEEPAHPGAAAEGRVSVFEWSASDRASFEERLQGPAVVGLVLTQVIPLSRKDTSLVAFEERTGEKPGPITVVQVDGTLTPAILAHQIAGQPGKTLVGVHRTDRASLLVFR